MILSRETFDMAILAAPVAVLILAALTLLLLLFRRHRLALLVGVFTLSFNYLTEQIPFRMKKDVPAEKPVGTIRILEYNICGKSEFAAKHDSAFIDYVLGVNADVLFLPENQGGVCPKLEKALKDTYPYSIHDYEELESKHHAYTEFTLYSRYPLSKFQSFRISHQHIIDACPWLDPDDVKKQYLDITAYKAEALIGNRPVTLLHVHLRSNNYDAAREGVDGRRKKAHNVFEMLQFGYAFRAEEARVIADSLRDCPNPLIVCGDFNDFSGSRCVRMIQDCRRNNVSVNHRDRLEDAWWNGGQGFGFTYVDQHLWLRLDHLLYSKEFALQGISIPTVPYSDHMPMVVDLKLRD